MNKMRFALLSGLAAIMLVDCVAAQSPSGSDELPVGNSTPEGAACDLVRAFISRDESLFHAVRPVSSCEGKLDPTLAFRRFMTHTPQPIDALKQEQSANQHPIQLVRSVPVTNAKPKLLEPTTPATADWGEVRWEAVPEPNGLNLLFLFGAIESKRFDVVTVLPSGAFARSRVEVMHIGAMPDSGGGLHELVPTGKWLAQFLPAPTLKSESE